jgi:hypothetical protein
MTTAKPFISEQSKVIIMRSSTYAIALTMLSLVWVWWHNHNNSSAIKNEHALAIPFDMGVPAAAQESASTTTAQNPVQAGAASIEAIKIPLAPQINNALSTAATKPVATTPATNDVSHVVTAQNTKTASAKQATNANDDDYDEQE